MRHQHTDIATNSLILPSSRAVVACRVIPATSVHGTFYNLYSLFTQPISQIPPPRCTMQMCVISVFDISLALADQLDDKELRHRQIEGVCEGSNILG